MALTLDIIKRVALPAGRAIVADITFDSSYPTGGEALSASDLGFNLSVEFVLAAPAGGLMFEYDHTNKKLKALYPTGGSATPAALADPAITVPAGGTAVTSTAAQPDLTETAGRGKEVAAATDLSTIVTRVYALGDNVGLDT